MNGSSKGYSPLQLVLHWLIVLLVFFQLVFGEAVGEYRHALRGGGPVDAATTLGYDLHIVVGLAILALVLLRLVFRLKEGVPPPVPGPALQLRIAAGLHHLFYFLLVAMPLTGLAALYRLVPGAGDVHELGKPVFILAIVLHAGAALYHHFLLKDTTLRRMLVPRSL